MAHVPVSLVGLQQQLDALQALCPVLLPSVVPHGYQDEDLWGLVHTEGPQQVKLLKSHLAAVIKKQQSQGMLATLGCCICGAAGQLQGSHEAVEDEDCALRFTTVPQVDFSTRTISLTRAGFACGQCRALRDPGRYLTFLGTKLGGGHPDRTALATGLCLHLAATNRAPDHVQGNPDALMVWAQEMISRAYALHVLASNISSWQMVGPKGSLVQQASPGQSLRLFKQLLSPAADSASAKPGSKRAAAVRPEADSRRVQPGSKKRAAAVVVPDVPQASRERAAGGQAARGVKRSAAPATQEAQCAQEQEAQQPQQHRKCAVPAAGAAPLPSSQKASKQQRLSHERGVPASGGGHKQAGQVAVTTEAVVAKQAPHGTGALLRVGAVSTVSKVGLGGAKACKGAEAWLGGAVARSKSKH